ncbi:MAG TPA: DMT family transporter [Acidimicrobiales bacterium]|nr:DMT family transporter [Acidimicrobiales bacterium]
MLKVHLAVGAAGVLFGTTFVVMKEALEDIEPMPLLAARFLIAGLVLAPFARPSVRRPSQPGIVRSGVACGSALAVGYVFQTVGLQHTTTGVSAFITFLLVVIVPVLSALTLRRFPTRWVTAGVLFAAAGLVLLASPSLGEIGLGYGELLTLGCAVAFAVHIVLLADLAPRFDTIRLNAIQLGFVGAVCFLPGIVLGGYDFSAKAWTAAVFTAVAASCGAFGLQVWGQRLVGPTRTSLLLMLEPVSAAFLGWAIGERLGVTGVIGASLILIGILLAELPTLRAQRTTDAL